MTALILPTESLEADFAGIVAGTIKRVPVTNKTLTRMLAAAKAAARHCQRQLPPPR